MPNIHLLILDDSNEDLMVRRGTGMKTETFQTIEFNIFSQGEALGPKERFENQDIIDVLITQSQNLRTFVCFLLNKTIPAINGNPFMQEENHSHFLFFFFRFKKEK